MSIPSANKQYFSLGSIGPVAFDKTKDAPKIHAATGKGSFTSDPQRAVVTDEDGSAADQIVRYSQLTTAGGGVQALNDHKDTNFPAPANLDVVYWDVATSKWISGAVGGVGGEANTASNQGVGGTGLFDGKVGVDLQFRNLISNSAILTVALDAPNKEVELDVDVYAIDHGGLSGLLDQVDHPWAVTIDGGRPLTGDWDIGAGRRIDAEEIRARSNLGLYLREAGGLGGIWIEDATGEVNFLSAGGVTYLQCNSVAGMLMACDFSVEGNTTLGDAAADNIIFNAHGNTDLEFNDGFQLIIDKIRARDADGLLLAEAGDDGIFIEDGGDIYIQEAAASRYIREEVYSTTGSHNPRFHFRRSHHNTLGTLARTLNNDYLGMFRWWGVNATPAFDLGATIYARQDGATAAFVPTNIFFETSSAAATNTNQLVLHNDNHVGFGTASPGARVEIETVATEGHAALLLHQKDADMPFVEYEGAYDNAAPPAAGNLTTLNPGGGAVDGPKNGTPGWAFWGMKREEWNGAEVWVCGYVYTP